MGAAFSHYGQPEKIYDYFIAVFDAGFETVDETAIH